MDPSRRSAPVGAVGLQILRAPLAQRPASQGCIAEAAITGELEHAPRRDGDRLVLVSQLHLSHHQGSVLPLEHIQHPVAPRQIKAMAPLAQPIAAASQQRLGVSGGDRILILIAGDAVGLQLEGQPG